MKFERTQDNRTFEEALAEDSEVLRNKSFTVPETGPFKPALVFKDRFYRAKNLLFRGFYARQLRDWLKHYELGKDLLVIRYERLLDEPSLVMNEILDFVGAPRHEFSDEAFNQRYQSKFHGPRRTSFTLSDEARLYLKQLYKPYNDELADMLGEEWRGVWDGKSEY
jgi:Sulfotransferase domain